MSWKRNFADYQNGISQKSADKLAQVFYKFYTQAANEIIPMFIEVYKEAYSTSNIKKLAPKTLYRLDAYWALLDHSKEKVEDLGNEIISQINNQFHTMYVDVFEGITPGGVEVPCLISQESIQTAIDDVWCVDQKNWRERVWISMTCLWDRLTGALMEAVIKKQSLKRFQNALQEEFDGNCKLLNTKISVDIVRIASKASLNRQVIARTMAQSSSVNAAAYIMTYGDESEINELPEEDVAEVGTLSNEVSTFGIIDSIIDELVSQLFDDANMIVEWVCEGEEPCDDCEDHDGELMTYLEAQGLYPMHPHCLCCLYLVDFKDDSMLDEIFELMEEEESGYEYEDSEWEEFGDMGDYEDFMDSGEAW